MGIFGKGCLRSSLNSGMLNVSIKSCLYCLVNLKNKCLFSFRSGCFAAFFLLRMQQTVLNLSPNCSVEVKGIIRQEFWIPIDL